MEVKKYFTELINFEIIKKVNYGIIIDVFTFQPIIRLEYKKQRYPFLLPSFQNYLSNICTSQLRLLLDYYFFLYKSSMFIYE